MTCPHDDDLALAALGERTLDHACDACRAKLDALARTVAAVRDRFETHPSDDDWALAALGERALAHECPDCAEESASFERTVTRVRAAFAPPKRRRWAWMGAAAAAALLLVAFWPRATTPVAPVRAPAHAGAIPVSIDGLRVEIHEPDLYIVWLFEE
jgi:hypothetical protein